MKRLVLLFAALLGFTAASHAADGPNAAFNLREFAQLPVVFNGRHQPLDSVARNSLVQMRDRYALYDRTEKRSVPAAEWLAEVMMNPDAADARKTFRVDHPDLLSLLKLPPKNESLGEDGKHYSWNQIAPGFREIEDQARRVLVREDPEQTKPPTDRSQRTAFEQSVLKLRNALTLYMRLKNTVQPQDSTSLPADLKQLDGMLPAEPAAVKKLAEAVDLYGRWKEAQNSRTPMPDLTGDVQRALFGVLEEAKTRRDGKPFDRDALAELVQQIDRFDITVQMEPPLLVPPAAEATRDEWFRMGRVVLDYISGKALPAPVNSWGEMAVAFRERNSTAFNAALAGYRQQLAQNPAVARDLKKAGREVFFNRLAPFYMTMPVYIVAFLLACFYWFNFAEWARKTAFWLIVGAFLVHTVGLIFRMWLEGRPPVTNLYSSAIFIGWGSVGLGLLLEKFWRNAIGLVVASSLGFATLVVAHNLALDGDTLQMLQAVLDTNFWLATHVVIVTLGYASTYVAGFLAMIYILRGVFTRTLDPATGRSLARMVYGIVCFATLFSFVGTVLGGIWADQSWGRFWGWDPKENGALIIVLWNALILHARWGGLVRERGLMNLAIIGNVVTSWSWFGTNMLGIGLHSYGFMSGAFLWLGGFILSQLALIGLGLLPQESWRSFRPEAARPAGKPGKPSAAAA